MHLDLRPLGIGEILDRAVNVFVRQFAVLVLILALIAVPVAIVQYAAAPSTAGLVSEIQRVLSVPPGHPEEQRAILRQITAGNRAGGFGIGLVLISAILGTLSTTACIIGVAQAYAGKVPSVREVYLEALRRWLPQLAAAAAFVGVGCVLALALGFAVVFIALAIGALAAASKVAAAVVGIPIGIIVVAAFFGAVILIYFAAQMTIVSIALEEANPIRGIAHGLRRTFSPAVFWRSALVGTIVFAVSFVGSLILISLALTLSALTHVAALYPVIAVVGSVALNALLTTFLVIYAFDVRVRREGFDLSLAAQEMPV